MAETVDVTIPVDRATADLLLANPRNREIIGRLIGRALHPAPGPSPLVEALQAMQEDARAAGLTEAIVDEELAAYNGERRG